MHTFVDSIVQLVPRFRDRQVTISPLTGGITNRNYRLDVEGEAFVLRQGGENTAELGIDREVEYACSQAAAALGVGPEVIAYVPEQAVLITRFLPGRTLDADALRSPNALLRVVKALRRYHDGPPGAGRFSPFVTVRTYHGLARQHGVAMPEELATALLHLDQIELSLPKSDPVCPCHNDLLGGNLLDDGEQVRIIDWEYAGMGSRFFDLGNLAANHAFDPEQEQTLLELYFGSCEAEYVNHLRLMRLASLLRESLWGYLQAGISTLEFDFLEYGRKHLQLFFTEWDKQDR